MIQPLKILVKYPSRGRPDRFFKSLDSIYNNFQDEDNFHVSCTLDSSDHLMNQPEIIDRIRTRPNISIEWGESNSKIEAVNRSMPDYDFDIIIVLSDDMQVTFYGFDQILRQEFGDGLDWLLHVQDNDAKDVLATMYIAGKDFYNRFGYCYNPIYHSLFCDNEIQEVAQQLGRYKLCPYTGLIFHGNPSYGHNQPDLMYIEQQKIGWSLDQQTYNERKAINFGL